MSVFAWLTIAMVCLAGLLLAACGASATPTPTATPTPAPPPVSEVWVATEPPSSFCGDDRIVVWGGRGTVIGGSASGWGFVDEPGDPLPPAPGHEVSVRSWERGFPASRTGWTGERVRIYAYPVEADMQGLIFWPPSGEDASLEACLGQTAFLLGEGPIGETRDLDFLLRLPDTVTRAGEEHSLAGLGSLGELALFAVTDSGYFMVGPTTRFAAPYTLTVTPGLAGRGETVAIEGTGFDPKDGSVVVTTSVAWRNSAISSATEVEIGRAEISDGSFRLEWTIPQTIEDTPTLRSPHPTPTFIVIEWTADDMPTPIGQVSPSITPTPSPPRSSRPDLPETADVLAHQRLDINVTVLDAAGDVVRDDYRVVLCVGADWSAARCGWRLL